MPSNAPQPSEADWTADRVGNNFGEEGESTLYPVEGDENRQMVQVWHDFVEWHDDQSGPPVVGFWASNGDEEYRFDFTPDQALDLAAMLIVHAEIGRQVALERALDE